MARLVRRKPGALRPGSEETRGQLSYDYGMQDGYAPAPPYLQHVVDTETPGR